MPGRRVRRCRSSPLQGEATPFSPSAGCGPLSWSRNVLPRTDHYRQYQRPHLARWRRTLCPPLHESTSLAALLRHFRSVPGRVAAAVTPYPPFRCRCTPDKESRAFDPRYFILSPCTPKGGLQAARQILSRSVLHSASTTHPLQVCSDSTSLTLVSVSTGFSLLFRVRSIPHTSSEGSQPSETVPSVLSVRSSLRHSSHRLAQRKILVSGLAIPGCARAFVFRLRGFRGAAGAQGLRRLNRSNHFNSTLSTSLSGRPDSFDSPSLALYLDADGSTSGGVTVIPRSNLIPSAACRGLRPCLLAVLLLREMSANAATPERAKPPSPTTLTHASAYCQERPVSPARARQKKIYQ